MGYRMTIDTQEYHITACNNNQNPIERTDRLIDNSGFIIELNNVFLDNIHLKWGKYTASAPKCYSVSPGKSSVTAHFCLSGFCITEGNSKLNVQRGESLLFKEEKDEYLYNMGTDNQKGSFFEISIDTDMYSDLFIGENHILDRILCGESLFACISQDYCFYSIITDMYNNKSKYSGKLKKLYLESKVMELFLLQLSYLKNEKETKPMRLINKDIEAIHQVKSLLDDTMEHISIPQLALTVGINQTKLKYGFRNLFGESIFAYLTSIRMKEAYHLLKHSDMSITLIAETVGYKHPQHFTVAFYKQFGLRPSDLRK